MVLLFPAHRGLSGLKSYTKKRLTNAPQCANLRSGVVKYVYCSEKSTNQRRRGGTAQKQIGFSLTKAGRPCHNASDISSRFSRIGQTQNKPSSPVKMGVLRGRKSVSSRTFSPPKCVFGSFLHKQKGTPPQGSATESALPTAKQAHKHQASGALLQTLDCFSNLRTLVKQTVLTSG